MGLNLYKKSKAAINPSPWKSWRKIMSYNEANKMEVFKRQPLGDFLQKHTGGYR
jgi:hypothetical protein